jgi:hypothetical protein
LNRSVDVHPAFDRRNEDAALNKGLQGIVLIFRVTGGGGRTEFELHTNWFPDDVHQGFMERGMFTFLRPLPKSLQQYSDLIKGRTFISEDLSRTGADEMFGLMLHMGDNAVWTALEKLHSSRFGEAQDASSDAPGVCEKCNGTRGRHNAQCPLSTVDGPKSWDGEAKPEPERASYLRPVSETHRRARIEPNVLLAAAKLIMEAHANGEN